MTAAPRRSLALWCLAGLAAVAAVAGVVLRYCPARDREPEPRPAFKPRRWDDTSGFTAVSKHVQRWAAGASLEEISNCWRRAGYRTFQDLEPFRSRPHPRLDRLDLLLMQAAALNFEGEAEKAYRLLEEARPWVEKPPWAQDSLYSLIFFQGVIGLRIGENDNCVLCRGESSCILPIAPAAIHTNPRGSRLAVKHFTEYLEQFPDDLGVRWLLNLAHMTLGEHPGKVDPRFLLSLEHFQRSEHGIGKFRDIGHLAGVNRFNQSGGAIFEDFDNDGLLDLVTTSYDPTVPMAYYRNRGDGTFEERTKQARLTDQLGGLYCVQGDYNNDGHMDVFVCRGAWLSRPIRPSLLRNNGDGTFTDVTVAAGLDHPVNSISATWADYDNDGHLDLFVCCEKQPNRLYRNRGDGTFEEVAAKAGVQGTLEHCKGAAWIDFDNDGYPDLFLNYLEGTAQLYRNNGNGTFTDVSRAMGIDGPRGGFSCWAFDYDNDGWLDLFATCFDHTLEDVVKGLLGQPHRRDTCKLYRNLGGRSFQDVTKEAGLDGVYSTMGSNFADLDNDGFLDFYLGTGDPSLAMLVPNRLFRNLAGRRFAEITASSGTGHLQKGHAVSCADWRRCGSVDLFIQTGGAIPGDSYHNVLFLNPGQGNNWLTLKLVGQKTNRAAIGARIKVVTAGEKPLTVHRHVSSGSSFGANPLQQTIGLGKAKRIARLEVHWPTSKTTQVFRDLAVNQALQVTEFASDVRTLDWKPVPLPKAAR